MEIKRDKDNHLYVDGGQIEATLYRGPYVCSCCHRTGDATRIRYPEAYWYKDELCTHFSALWLCSRCCNKLLKALNNPTEEAPA